MRGTKALRALVLVLAALIALAFAATAQADYEQVGLFAQSGAGEQLEESAGAAVNTTGAGGVEPGSFYVSAGNHVSRYNAKGEIKEVWGWNTIASGPDKTAGFERCRPANGDICAPQTGRSIHEEGVGYFYSTNGVAVDPSTGYVYVLNQVEYVEHYREHNLIEVFSADGSEVIARFGDAPAEGETVETGPEKVSETLSIAVDEDGTVYLGTSGGRSPGYTERVMCFHPENGDFEHYAYCGRSQDIEAGYPQNLAFDDAGHLYLANEEFIQEFSSAASTAALCTFLTHGQLHAMTVNPATGEVFYFNGTDSTIHRLKPCNPAKGKFEEAQARVKISPVETFGPNIRGLAFNPTLSWGPNRPPGVLYGAAGDNFESSGVHYHGLGYIFAPAEVRSPAVLSESVSNTRTTSTVLRAEIDPNGFGTHYIFQYLTAAQYEANPSGERFAGATEAPIGGGEIGGGSIGQVTAAISGLTPDTAYRFRVIATSECNGGGGAPCVSEGEASSFATYPLFPPGLPDHRAYEMVSPAQKHGAEVLPAEPYVSSCLRLSPTSHGECKPNSFGNVFPMQSSPDGEALAYEGQPFNPFEGAVDYDSYVSRRTASGWQTTALIPAQPPSGVSQLAFDAGLDQGLLSSPSLGSERASLALQPTSQPGSLTPLLSEEPPNRTSDFKLTYGGHSADFSRIFFTANDTLTEETPFAPEPPDPGASGSDLYEWHEGQLALVNVLPGNTAVAEGAKFASISPDTHAVSDDGSRVYFEDEAGNLYVRIDGEETVQLATSQRTTPDPLGARASTFMGASPNGTEALFSSSEELTDDANTGLAQEVVVQATTGTYKLTFQGDATGATGTGATTAGSKEVTGLTTSTGTFIVGETVSGAGIPPETKIAAVGTGTLTLSSAATATGTGVALAADLSWKATNGSPLQSALEALASIGKGNVTESAGKEGPVVTFVNSLALNQEPMTVDGSGLTGTVSLRSFRPGKALYLWNEGTLTDLTAGQGSWAVQGIAGAARDLSRIYFVDTAVLAGNEGAGLDSKGNAQIAEAGKDNLYSWSGGEARFVAQLIEHLVPEKPIHNTAFSDSLDWANNPAARTAEASPSGRFLAFTSVLSLTGYSNLGTSCFVSRTYPEEVFNDPCTEAFLYDSASGKLTCASCNPTGEAPLGNTTLRRIEGAREEFPQPRYLTDEGRLYFDSQDSLVARDTNEGVEDVYEYSPKGAGAEGTCEREAGCIRLISAGTEPVDSNLIAVDETGRNVFFDTRDRLALKDKDDLLDVYDAREGGGIAAETEIARAECQGENCQAPVSPPNDPTPGSSTFEGAGNVKEAPVAKKHAKKHKHAKNHKKAKKHSRTAKRNHGGAK
jgi:hypothetical protein